MKVIVFGNGSDFKKDGPTHSSVKELWEHCERQIMTQICFDESSHDKTDARQTYLFYRNFENFGSFPKFSEISEHLPRFPRILEDF